MDREDVCNSDSVAATPADEDPLLLLRDHQHPVNHLTDQLVFHPRCGIHAAVVNGGLTAHRPNAQSDFNHGVVLTSRHLKPNEIFEVALDQVRFFKKKIYLC